MHEIGVLFEVVKTVEAFAAENEVEHISGLVLQIGELSSMIPKYMMDLYPAAVEGSILGGSELEIEVIPANGRCRECSQIFRVTEAKGRCPKCESHDWELLSGKEFNIKEITCYEV